MPTKNSLLSLASLASSVSVALVTAAVCSTALAQQPAPPKARAPAATAISAVPDESQPGLSKGEVKAIREFKMLDFNGDGKLSRSEVKLFPRLAAAFDDADTDHDGFASYAEVRAFAAKYRTERDRKKAEQAAAQSATPPAAAGAAAPEPAPGASSAPP